MKIKFEGFPSEAFFSVCELKGRNVWRVKGKEDFYQAREADLGHPSQEPVWSAAHSFYTTYHLSTCLLPFSLPLEYKLLESTWEMLAEWMDKNNLGEHRRMSHQREGNESAKQWAQLGTAIISEQDSPL